MLTGQWGQATFPLSRCPVSPPRICTGKGRDEKGDLQTSGSLRLWRCPPSTTAAPNKPQSRSSQTPATSHPAEPRPRSEPAPQPSGRSLGNAYVVQVLEPRAVHCPDLWDRPFPRLQQPLSPCRTPHVGPSLSHQSSRSQAASAQLACPRHRGFQAAALTCLLCPWPWPVRGLKLWKQISPLCL